MVGPRRIAITTGDPKGIGPEVVAKALRKIGPKKNIQFALWRNSEFPKKDLDRIKKSFNLIMVRSWAEGLSRVPGSPKEILDICATTNPAIWVEEAATACFFRHLDAIATAPLSKPTIQASGLRDLGHTEILKRVSQTENAFMTFLGEHFNVMVVTGHTPIRKVHESLSPEKLTAAITAASELMKRLAGFGSKNISKKPIGVLGLNPHCGDSGLIGTEEQDFITSIIEKFKDKKFAVEGPLVPDAAFMKDKIKKYGVFLALYHDQGLIPFKAAHGQAGVHVTWGLPFVRTSVDHGTAFDIAGHDKADATSMRLAIEWAIRLCEGGQ